MLPKKFIKELGDLGEVFESTSESVFKDMVDSFVNHLKERIASSKEELLNDVKEEFGNSGVDLAEEQLPQFEEALVDYFFGNGFDAISERLNAESEGDAMDEESSDNEEDEDIAEPQLDANQEDEIVESSVRPLRQEVMTDAARYITVAFKAHAQGLEEEAGDIMCLALESDDMPELLESLNPESDVSDLGDADGDALLSESSISQLTGLANHVASMDNGKHRALASKLFTVVKDHS